MEIVKIRNYPIMGWSIVIRNLSFDNLKKLEEIISLLGLKRNRKFERFIDNISIKNIGKAEFVKLRRDYINKTFESQNHEFGFNYVIEHKLLAGTWRSKIYSGEEFASLILSNSAS